MVRQTKCLAILLLFMWAITGSGTAGFAETLAAAEYDGGDGSLINPYQIANLAQLRRLSETPTDWKSSFAQTADINATETSTWNGGAGFNPIGNGTQIFLRNYDGKGHTISGLYINRPATTFIGFFGYIGFGDISNLNLERIDIKGDSGIGGLVGRSMYGSITNCHTSGKVNGLVYIAGLLGMSLITPVTACSSSVDVSGTSILGGLVAGTSEASMISGCYATGNVIGNATTGNATYIGGLVGGSAGNIYNCYAQGNVQGDQHVGGLTGSGCVNNEDLIFNCYSTGVVSGLSNVGGLMGSIGNGTVTSSYWDTHSSGISTSAGGTGKTTSEMKQEATFTDWDFASTWGITENSYPYLQCMPPVFKSYIPYIDTTQDYWTGIALSSTRNDQSNPYTIDYYNNDGTKHSSQNGVIDPQGQWVGLASPGNFKGWAQITSTHLVDGLALIGENGQAMFDLDLKNGLGKTIVSSHLATNVPEWNSLLMACNPFPSQAVLNCVYRNRSGVQSIETKVITIPAMGSIQTSLNQLLGSVDGGTLTVTSDQGIAAFLLYDGTGDGGYERAGLSFVVLSD